MPYYQDLKEKDGYIYVGWLTYRRPFDHGAVDTRFLDALKMLCAEPTRSALGVHCCEFCRYSWRGIFGTLFRWPSLAFGSGVIEVSGRGGKIYCAPSMIHHYVKTHGYRPPDEFVDAVLESCGDD